MVNKLLNHFIFPSDVTSVLTGTLSRILLHMQQYCFQKLNYPASKQYEISTVMVWKGASCPDQVKKQLQSGMTFY